MRRIFVGLALCTFVVGSRLCAASEAAETDQFGQSHDLATGPATTVVDFAASWCDPCWKTLPRLQEMADKMPAIRFVVVDIDEKVEGRDLLVQRLGLKVPVVWDTKQRVAERFGPEGMPATFVLDAKGQVLYKHMGSDPKDWDKLEAFLAARPS